MITPDSNLFGALNIWFKKFCLPNEITQYALAKYTDIHQVYISLMMAGKRPLSISHAIKISTVLGIDPAILLQLCYIETGIKKLLNAYPELEKYQEHIRKIIDDVPELKDKNIN